MISNYIDTLFVFGDYTFTPAIWAFIKINLIYATITLLYDVIVGGYYYKKFENAIRTEMYSLFLVPQEERVFIAMQRVVKEDKYLPMQFPTFTLGWMVNPETLEIYSKKAD